MDFVENENFVSIKLSDFCRDCNLELINGEESDEVTIGSILVNRPGLLLAGFEDYFGNSRIQLIGNAEHFYLMSLSQEEAIKAAERVYSQHIPCVIYSRDIKPLPIEIEMAKKYKIPVMGSRSNTTALNTQVANYLEELLAPMTTIHGTLMDVNGIGVLITGESGMGKSEAAIELIQRGHRLVTDDITIVKRIGNELIGSSPEKTKFLLEIRGLGIIDVSQMYGAGSVLLKEGIMMIIKLEKSNGEVIFDRLGNSMKKQEILGIEVPYVTVPVTAGRNMSTLIEVAARNFRLKNMGFDALEVLKQRAKID